MGGCFPCFGSSNKEDSKVKEVVKKDSLKEGSIPQSHHVNRVSSGQNEFLDLLCQNFSSLYFFIGRFCSNCVEFCFLYSFCWFYDDMFWLKLLGALI